MKNLKFAILAVAALGLVGIFLPIISEGGLSISLWDLRPVDSGQVYITLFGFLVPALVAVAAVAAGPAKRWHGGVAIAGFALALIKVRDLYEGAIGGKLMFFAAIIGLGVALAATVKPERQVAA